jgi:L-ascorbate metabolism protein UlaG (beta-lactamase superfamily)
MLHFKNPNAIPFRPENTLQTVWDQWPGTPKDTNGKYCNHHQPMTSSFWDVFRWQTSPNPYRQQKRAEKFSLVVNDANSFLHSKTDGIVWLGHASFLIRIGGKLLIIDPILDKYNFLAKRYHALPVATEALKNIDYLLLSHDHFDHANQASISLLAKQNPQMQYLTGLDMKALIAPWTGSSQIQEAGWYQQYRTEADLQIVFVPSRHWCNRGISINKRLWGGFIIKAAGKTIYFAGDSGYGEHFKEIKQVFPSIDYAMIGIGAYSPQWFMSPSHTSPAEAYQAFLDCGAKTMIPMHYGTFDLADEPMSMPLSEISAIKQTNNAPIKPLIPGEVLSI